MSESSSSQKPEKKKSGLVKRRAEPDSALQPSFAAARQERPSGSGIDAHQDVLDPHHHQGAGSKQGQGVVKREQAGSGEEEQSRRSGKVQSEPLGAARRDFSGVPALTVVPLREARRSPVEAVAHRPTSATAHRQVARQKAPVAKLGRSDGQHKLSEGRPRGRQLGSPVLQHLKALGSQVGFEPSVYREEIAGFQKVTPRSDILAQQQRLLPHQKRVEVRQRDNSQTLRRCAQSNVPASAFQSELEPGRGGALTADSGETHIDVSSAPYEAKGKVITYEGGQSEVRQWEAGFIQTQTAGTYTAHYAGSSDKWGFKLPSPRRDALSGSRAPWYDAQGRNRPGVKRMAFSGAWAKLGLWDQPTVPTPWETPDGKGKLQKTEGKLQFTTWLAVRHRKEKRVEPIKWATWMVDVGATYNYDAKTITPTSGKTETTGSGEGQGSTQPVLEGETANVAVRNAIKWS